MRIQTEARIKGIGDIEQEVEQLMKSENLKIRDLRPGNVMVADYMEVEQRHEQFVVNHVHIFARRTVRCAKICT